MPSHTVTFIVHVCGNALYIGTQCLIQNDEEQAIFVRQNTYATVISENIGIHMYNVLYCTYMLHECVCALGVLAPHLSLKEEGRSAGASQTSWRLSRSLDLVSWTADP